MSYLVLARKWRPQGFNDLIGQAPIVKILSNAIDQNKIAHAYVFSGPRGVGKTSTARILAKSLNCSEGPTKTPCGKCPSCIGITDSSSVDVTEIDGASNNSVDDIRDLRERVKYAPSGGKHKVYIIDEAHMLSTSAFNALLKTLEEPPPHVIFVLATTEARKIPLTVLSRCQHLPFRRVSTNSIRDRLKFITDSEGIAITDGALAMVARAADGSIRDSLTILDQVASFSQDITEDEIKNLMDAADFDSLSEVARAMLSGDRPKIIDTVATLVDGGTDLRSFTRDLIGFFRDMLVVKLSSASSGLVEAGDDELKEIEHLCAQITEEHLTLVLSELVKAENDVKMSFSPRVALEMSLLKISYLSAFRHVNDALAAIGSPILPESENTSVSLKLTTTREPAKKQVPQHIIAAYTEEVEESFDEEIEILEDTHPSAPKEYTGDLLLKDIIDSLDDGRVAGKLSSAEPTLEGDTLYLMFREADAVLCAIPIKDNPAEVEKAATRLRGAPTKIEVHISRTPQEAPTPLRQRALAEPLVQEALDLFDGRVVDIKEIKE